MEPTFTEVSSETVTAKLVAQLTTAIAALPQSLRERACRVERGSVCPSPGLGLHKGLCHCHRVCKDEKRSGCSTVYRMCLSQEGDSKWSQA
jgi:hypothetical protein